LGNEEDWKRGSAHEAMESLDLRLRRLQDFIFKFNLRFTNQLQIYGLPHHLLSNARKNLKEAPTQSECSNIFCETFTFAETGISSSSKDLNYSMFINRDLLEALYLYFLANQVSGCKLQPYQLDQEFVTFIHLAESCGAVNAQAKHRAKSAKTKWKTAII